MGVNDLWHLTDAREGQPKCRQHNKVPSKLHGKGKRWEVRKGKFRQAFDKYAEAKQASDNLSVADIQSSSLPIPTFADFCAEWLAGYSADPATRINAEQTIRLHIEPYLKGETLKDLESDVMFWRSWLQALRVKYARSTVVKHYNCAKQIINTAVMAGLIDRNPLLQIKPPSAPQRVIEPWTSEMVCAMRDAMPEEHKLAIDLGTVGGMRISEIAGLSAKDFTDDQIHIRRQIQHVETSLLYKLPKHNKQRTIPVPTSLIKRIREHIDLFGTHEITLPNADGTEEIHPLLFVSTRGGPLYGPLHQRIWSAARKEAGIPAHRDNGTHAMRHYCASIALFRGVDLKTLSVYLGHSSVATTARYYIHLMRQGADVMRSAMESLL